MMNRAGGRLYRLVALASLGVSIGALTIGGNVHPWWLGATWFFTITTVSVGELLEW